MASHPARPLWSAGRLKAISITSMMTMGSSVNSSCQMDILFSYCV